MLEIAILSSGSKGNCYRVSDGETSLLIECGVTWRRIQIAFDFRTSSITGCLLSHEHGDHAKPTTLHTLVEHGVPIMASPGTCKALHLDDKLNANLRRFDRWIVQGFPVQHNAVEPWGFLVKSRMSNEKLLYLTDTAYTKYTFYGLTHIMLEANHSTDIMQANVAKGSLSHSARSRIATTHMSLETCKKLLLANDLSLVREIWLLHLSDGNSDAAAFKREIQEATGKIVYVA